MATLILSAYLKLIPIDKNKLNYLMLIKILFGKY